MTEKRKPRRNLTTRWTDDGLAEIDRLRNRWTRAQYIRAAVADWVRRSKQGPTELTKDEEL